MASNARPALTEREADVQQAVWQQLAKQRKDARAHKGGPALFSGEFRSIEACEV